MKTVLSLLLLTASAAGPAAAQDIHVSLSGKSAAVIREDIGRAAVTACISAYREEAVGFHELNACERAASEDAMRQARAVAAAKPA